MTNSDGICVVTYEPPFQLLPEERLAWSVYKETISLSGFNVESIPTERGSVTLFIHKLDKLEWVLKKLNLEMTREAAVHLIDMVTTIASTIRNTTVSKYLR